MPIMYQDDVARLATSPSSVQSGNIRMEAMAESKLLDFNLQKSGFIAIGSQAVRKATEDDLADNPITLFGQVMKKFKEAKYLGDWISEKGLSESVVCTVNKRKGLAIAAIHEIRSVVDDCRSNICGGLQVGLDIWEVAILPMLLYNSECWTGITSRTMEDLEDIQRRFLRHLVGVGSGCPIPALYWETGCMPIKYRILKNKLIFYHHLATLPSSSLAQEIFSPQESLELPGLATECQDFLITNRIDRVKLYSKLEWKRHIKNIVCRMVEDDLRTDSLASKKINFTGESFGRKHYIGEMKTNDGRLMFKYRSRMTPEVQMNFMSNTDYARDMWTCTGCKTVENEKSWKKDSQEHILICPGYSELRQNKDLTSDGDLVAYFREVILLRQNQIS